METSGHAEASLCAGGTNLFLGKIDRINSLESMYASVCTRVLGYLWEGEPQKCFGLRLGIYAKIALRQTKNSYIQRCDKNLVFT